MLRQSGRFAAMGLEMGLAVIIGIYGGRWLDGQFDTEPVFFWIGLVVGLGAAIKAVVDAARSARRSMVEDGSSRSEKD